MKPAAAEFYATTSISAKRMLRRTLSAAFAASLLFGLPVPGSAQDVDTKKLAMNSLEKVDDDFQLMGEYQGFINAPSRGLCRVGVQVIAIGDGKFGGMQYACGLPGTGWNGRDRTKLEGERTGDTVQLTGEGTGVVVANGVATVSRYDQVAGQLPKVHRMSPTLGQPAPANAYTLFDGHDTAQFKDGAMTEGGLLKEGTELLAKFRDYTLHVEYRLPYMPHARGQGRSNSGIYLQSSYEVQVLDSFGLEGVHNECGALYRYRKPDQNMCLPPLSWQTYDLTFRSPRFDWNGNKICNARITVLHNGVVIHDNFEIERKTGAGKQESDRLWPIKFQDHSNPVRFRNIWLIDLERPTQFASHGSPSLR